MNGWRRIWNWLTNPADPQVTVEDPPEYPIFKQPPTERRDFRAELFGARTDVSTEILQPARTTDSPTTKGGENVRDNTVTDTTERGSTMTSTATRYASYFTTDNGETVFNLDGYTSLATAKNEARTLGYVGEATLDGDNIKVTFTGNDVEVSATAETSREAWAKALGALYAEVTKPVVEDVVENVVEPEDEESPDFEYMDLSELVQHAEACLANITKQVSNLRSIVSAAQRSF